MGKSLIEAASAVLKGHQKSLDETAASNTLKAGSKSPDPPKKLPGEREDLGGPNLKPHDTAPVGAAKAGNRVKKAPPPAKTDKTRKIPIGQMPGGKLKSIGLGVKSGIGVNEELEDQVQQEEDTVAVDDTPAEDTVTQEDDTSFDGEEVVAEEDDEVVAEEDEEAVTEDSEEIAEDDGSEEAVTEEDETEVAEEELPGIEVDVGQHVDAIVANEEGLSEDFKAKVATVVEAAIVTGIQEYAAKIEEAYDRAFDIALEQVETNLSESMNSYLSYVVEQWIEENQVSVEAGLRTEITEDFINGFFNLCQEHYIDVPETKFNVVEEIAEENQSLKAKLDEEIAKNIEMASLISEQAKALIINDACVGLTEVQAQQLRKLAENVDFSGVDDFVKKVDTLKESYSKTPVKKLKELDKSDSTGQQMISESNPRMDRYTHFLKKTAE
jgi:predicted ester cyclase